MHLLKEDMSLEIVDDLLESRCWKVDARREQKRPLEARHSTLSKIQNKNDIVEKVHWLGPDDSPAKGSTA